MTEPVLHIDFETRSTVDLKKTGVYVYAEHPDTDIWCAAYSFDDGPIELWIPGQPCPPAIVAHVKAGGLIYAHNAQFERIIWREVLTGRYGWPVIDLGQWRCTMAMALAMSLPASLNGAAAAVGLDIQKDMTGHALMMRMCRPRKRNPDGSILWWDVPERKERLYAYCKTDVEVERQLHKRLLPLREYEQQLWFADQRINDRGVYVDADYCEAARRVVSDAMNLLNEQMKKATGYKVAGVTRVADLTRFVRERGVEDVDSLAKGDLADLLARQDIPDDVRRALEIRQEGGKASVAKIDALLRGRSADGRAKGLVQYHAASTGRWAGRRFQPQNLKRPDEETDIEAAIETIRKGHTARTVEWMFGSPLSIVGDTIRGMVIAKPGNILRVADYVSIEGVVLPWLAGEKWKMDAFRAYRAGEAPDLYIQGYCKAFRCPIFDKKDPRRQVGKVMELASGYQGGHGAYLRMGASGKKLDELVTLLRAGTSTNRWLDAAEKYPDSARNLGLTCDQWTALRLTIDAWRDSHPNIKQFWWDLEDAAVKAVENPGAAFSVGGGDRPWLIFKKQGSFMWLRLPSGRALCYPYPRVEVRRTPWGADKKYVVYKGVDAYTRKWGDCWVYGGLLAENVTQAVARDVLADAIMRCEARGYEITLHVHDEAVSETSPSFGSLSEFTDLIEEVPAWATGCPIAAEGWEGDRYKKA